MSAVKFKSIKKRQIRRRNSSDEEKSIDDAEELDHSAKLSETLELQKLRKRPHGVNAVTLASGKKVTKIEELVHNDPDPFKLKTGGLLTLDKGKFRLAGLYYRGGERPFKSETGYAYKLTVATKTSLTPNDL